MQQLLFSFEGRANRAKWWGVTIGADIVFLVIAGIATAVFGTTPEGTPAGIGLVITVIAGIVFIWVALAVAVRRWHDRNKSGWWVLIALIPVVGGIWYLIECGFLRGTVGPNKYGADPLGGV